MSALSPNYISKVEAWIRSNVALERTHMSADQMFRAQLAAHCYHEWTAAPYTNIRQLVERVAKQKYSLLLDQAAQGDEGARAMVQVLNIRPGVPRRPAEIANDISLVNHLVGVLNVSKTNIHRAMYEDNAVWLTAFGRRTGDWRAVAKANDQIARIENDFKDNENPQDQMPNTNINITGDVSIIKKDRQSKTDEERAALRRKWGLTAKEEAQELEEINGIWQAPDPDEPDPDVFIENENDK